MRPPKVLLVANSSWYLFHFRLQLLNDLRDAGYDLELVAPLDRYTVLLESKGFRVHSWRLSRRSINPLSEVYAIWDLLQIYRSFKPILVHHFTIKACLYGTIAAKGAHVYSAINSFTGLGHFFIGTRKRNILLRYAIKPIYRAVFRARRSTFVFQNDADKEEMESLGIIRINASQLIRGSGVDIDYFNPSSVPCARTPGDYHDPLQLLFPSRLIREKGLCELLQACRGLRASGIYFQLLVAGAIDVGNRSSLSHDDIYALQRYPYIRCLDHVADMRALYAVSDLVVLPSWREGLSRSLIEAAAMERPIITTDVPGCRDVVDHGRSGLLVPLRDARGLELAIRLLIDNPDLARRFGKEARRKVTAEFQVGLVNLSTLETYRRLLHKPHPRTPFLQSSV